MTQQNNNSTLKTKQELLVVGTDCLSKLFDAATTDVKKLKIQRLWYQSLHMFSANVMQSVIPDDFGVGQCPSDMERCSDGSCMPPGQC